MDPVCFQVTVSRHSEVDRSSRNIEVALVLDILSMAFRRRAERLGREAASRGADALWPYITSR